MYLFKKTKILVILLSFFGLVAWGSPLQAKDGFGMSMEGQRALKQLENIVNWFIVPTTDSEGRPYIQCNEEKISEDLKTEEVQAVIATILEDTGLDDIKMIPALIREKNPEKASSQTVASCLELALEL